MNSAGKCLCMRVVLSAFMASIALDGLCLARSTDERNVWNGLHQAVESLGSNVSNGEAADLESLLKAAENTTNLVERQERLSQFKRKLFSVDSSRVSYERMSSFIEGVWNTALLLRCAIPVATVRDHWAIRMEALAWIKQQIERLENNEPEDRRTWPEKWGNLVLPKNEKHNQWERLKKQMRASYAKNFIRLSAQRIEDDRHTEEFREWARAEMEKVIGRPLTDDDYMFKDDVLRRREERKRRAHDEEVRKPHDGGDVLPHPFTFLGCTFGNAYEVSRRGGKDALGDVILCWYSNYAIEPYFGKKWMMLNLAPRSKIAYSAKIDWWGQNTREELFAFAKDIRADIEKRLGVKLGEFFFEGRSHVCDEATWWKADWGCARSRSVFGPILIELEAADKPGNLYPCRRFTLTITDTAAEALVEKERKENPLKYDREAERRKFEQLKEMNRRRKVIPAKNTTK